MREVARRAGVSHAALAYQFGDKAGLFTAIAIEGFRQAAATISEHALGSDAFISGGIAYVAFALSHPGHFEIMFRPDLYHRDDQQLVHARNAAFDVLYGSARSSAGSECADIEALAITGWSLVHGLATLWLTANLDDRLDLDPSALAQRLTSGICELGELAHRYRTPSGPTGPEC